MSTLPLIDGLPVEYKIIIMALLIVHINSVIIMFLLYFLCFQQNTRFQQGVFS